MLDEREGPVIRNPQILLLGKHSGGVQLPPADVQARKLFNHGEVLGLEGHGPSIQISIEHRLDDIIQPCRLHGWQPSHEHHPIVVGRGRGEFPAEKLCDLIDMEVRRALAPHHFPDIRILGHACPLDRRKHQSLEPDGAVSPVKISEQRGHHPVGGSVVGLAGISLDRGHRGESDEELQAGPFRGRK